MKIYVIFGAFIFWSLHLMAVPADNSAINQRDQQSHEYTADQQGLSKRDTEITQKIRQSLIKEKSLSMYAKNIKIITVDGEVTLKGPVKTVREQTILFKRAQAVAGVDHVYNQTDIIYKDKGKK